MEKENFFIVYLEDSKTGNRFWDSRFTWSFTNEDDADDFASSLSCLVISRYIVSVAMCSSGNFTIFKEVR